MKNSVLKDFTEQLAQWAETALSEGRFPFRRIEMYPHLITSAGERQPPLVFWINRDSLMAGGVVLMPETSAEEGIEEGRACCRALGLRHFCTWAPREIVIWEERNTEIFRHRTISFPEEKTSARQFQQGLWTVMEEFKLLSVLGAIAPNELGPHFFANLCRFAYESVLPGLLETFRIAQGEHRFSEGFDPADLTRSKSACVLIRILALLAEDALPLTIRPEGLEKALLFALESLPAPLAETLSPAEDEEELPPDCAIRFHHLLLRLSQLQLTGSKAGIRKILEIFVEHEGNHLGGYPAPPALRSAAPGTGVLAVFPDRLYPTDTSYAQVASPPMASATALIRQLKGAPPFQANVTDIFDLPQDLHPEALCGTLSDTRVPTANERRALIASLRTSWPNRRFSLPARTPRWAWECIHLLGSVAEGGTISLDIPEDWLYEEFGKALWELLCDQFTVESLSRHSETLRLQLLRRSMTDVETLFHHPGGDRRIPWQSLKELHPSSISLALHLPDALFELLLDSRFQAPKARSKEEYKGIERFGSSSLGRLLWHVVSGGGPLPAREEMAEKFSQKGFPLPSRSITETLDMLATADESPSRAMIDRELQKGPIPDIRPEDLIAFFQTTVPRRKSVRQRISLNSTTAEEIEAAVFIDGLPLFPEHYLYDFFRPTMEEFRFSGPLRRSGEFFGQITLEDAQGSTFTVDGLEIALALELASHGDRDTVSLPKDRNLIEILIERYLKALKKLHMDLVRETHVRLSDARAAENLVRQIWKSLPLPPWEMVE